MRPSIAAIDALEILDSRGNPTLRVYVTLADGTRGVASVPSGASTGENEAVELRDGDASRYGGKGVRKAVSHVKEALAPRLLGMDPGRQAEIDRLMIDLRYAQQREVRRQRHPGHLHGGGPGSGEVGKAAALRVPGRPGGGAPAGADDEHP